MTSPAQYELKMAILDSPKSVQEEIERLRIGHDRYETARRMSPRQWADAWKLNISTGKPFDEIIDHLQPFMVPK